MDFDLTVDWLAAKLAGRCELSGVEFDFVVAKRKQPGPRSPSVDRVRAGEGYTQSNCRVICSALNSALGNWGLGEFLPIAEALVARHSKDEAA